MKTSEPAFPCEWSKVHHTPGMTLRDYFAAKAMQAQIGNPFDLGSDVAHKLVAELAYRMADAMLKAREQ